MAPSLFLFEPWTFLLSFLVLCAALHKQNENVAFSSFASAFPGPFGQSSSAPEAPGNPGINNFVVSPKDVFELFNKAFLACLFFSCPVARAAFQFSVFLDKEGLLLTGGTEGWIVQ